MPIVDPFVSQDVVDPFASTDVIDPFASTGTTDPYSSSPIQEQTPMPENWIGRPLNAPIQSVAGGQEYLNLVQKNATSRRGIFEELADVEKKDIWFAGAFLEIPDLIGVTSIFKKMAKEEPVTDEELVRANNYMEFSRRKGLQTMGAKVVDTTQLAFAWMADIAAASILSGLFAPEPVTTAAGGTIAASRVARIAATKTASIMADRAAKAAAMKFVRKSLTGAPKNVAAKYVGKLAAASTKSAIWHSAVSDSVKYATRSASRTFLKSVLGKSKGIIASKYLGNVAKAATTYATLGTVNQLLSPQRTVRSIAEHKLSNVLKTGDEHAASAIAKGIMETNISFGSEFMGEYLGAVAKRLLPAKTVKNMISGTIFETALKRVSQSVATPTAKQAWQYANNIGVNGMFEEVLEERLDGFLRGLTGVSGDAGIHSAISEAIPSLEDAGVEIIAFSIMPFMINTASKATGGMTAAEIAADSEIFQNIVKSPQDTFAVTESDANKLVDTVMPKLNAERAPWYSDTPFKFLENIFGKTKRGPLQSALIRKGVGNLRERYDQAMKADPENPNAGRESVGEFISMLRRVQSTGVWSDQDVELFNAGVKSGDILRKQRGNAVRYFASKEALNKKEYETLVKQTGIQTPTEIDDLEEKRIGEYSLGTMGAPWGSLSGQEKKNLSIEWHSKNMVYIRDKYNFIQGILKTGETGGIRLHETLPFIATGTAEQFTEHGYPISNLTDVWSEEDGVKRYAMDLSVVTSADGMDLDISTHAPNWAISEDLLESKLKQHSGLEMFPEAVSWINGIRQELSAKKNPTAAEQRIATMLSKPKGRFEFLSKTYNMNKMGYKMKADRFSSLLTSYEIPDDVNDQMLAIVGEKLVNALAKTPVKASEAAVAAEAPVAETSPLIDQLAEALDQDLSKPENIQAAQDLMDKIDDSDNSFSLSEMKIYKGAEAQKIFADIKARLDAKQDIGKKTKVDLDNLREFMRDERARPERSQEYPTPEPAMPVYGVEEITKALPQWFEHPVLEAVKEDFVNDYDNFTANDAAEMVIDTLIKDNPLTKAALNQFKREDESTVELYERLVEDISDIPKKIHAATARYQPGRRAESRTVTMPERRVRGGKKILAARTASSKPYRPDKTPRFDINPDDFAGESLDAEEQRFVDEQFGEDSPSIEKERIDLSTVERDEEGFAKEPRPFWQMKPLRNEALAQQLMAIIPTGSKAMLDLANDLKQHYLRKPAVVKDAVYIPSNKKYGSHDGWLRRITKKQWKKGESGALQWDPRQLPHLSKTRSAIKDTETDVEGAILVIDHTARSLENRLGLPMQRAMHVALTGEYPNGKAYPIWNRTEYPKWSKRAGQGIRMSLDVDVDEILGEIDEPIEVTDFMSKTNPAAWRAAVFPISAQRLEGIKTQKQIDAVASEIHDWMRRNKIRRLMIGGLDQIESRGTYDMETKEGETLIFDNTKIVNPSWALTFSQVLKKAISSEVSKKRADTPEAQPIELDEATIKGLEADMKAGGTTFSLGSNDVVMGTVYDDIITTFVVPKTKQIMGHEAYFGPNLAYSDRFWAYPDGRIDWWEEPNVEIMKLVEDYLNEKHGLPNFAHYKFGDRISIRRESAPTFALGPLSPRPGTTEHRIWKAIKEVNNNRLSDGDSRRYTEQIFSAMTGDPTAKEQVLYNLGRHREAFRAYVEQAGVVRPEAVPEPPVEEQTELNLEDEQITTSMSIIEDIYQDLDPAFRSGAIGFHKMMLDQSREFRAIKYEEGVFIDNMNRRLGMEESKKKLPPNHKQIAQDMLASVGARLDGSKRVPLRRTADGVEWEDHPEKWAVAWDAHIKANNLKMPEASKVYQEIRAKYDAVRVKANQIMSEFSDQEWIRYIEDYVNHHYRYTTKQDQEKVVKSITEEARQAQERRFPSYEKAAVERGLIPATMNALDLYRTWNNTVWAAARNKTLVSIASVIRDVDGAPIVIPVQGEQALGQDQLVNEKTLRETARYLASFLEKDHDRAVHPALEIRRMVGEMNAEENDYIRINSPFTKSVDYFLVRKGVTENLMKTVLNYGRIDKGWMNALETFNSLSKFMMLSFSAFHPFSLAESLSAVFGVQLGNPAFHIPSTYRNIKGLVADMKAHPENYKDWYRAGLTGDVGNPDVRLGVIEDMLKRGIDKLEPHNNYMSKVAVKGLQGLRSYKHWLDKWLWHEYMPGMKMYSAEFVMSEWQKENSDADADQIMETRKQIAEYINPAFGGLEWEQFTWATPQVRQWLHALIFAPDWTLSSAQISGLTRIPLINKMHATNLSPLMKDQMLRKYWPAMTAIVLFGLPNMIQLMIYAVAGDPDEDDQPFTFLNEPGRRGHIDFTPIFRHLPNYQGDVSGKRRVYMRWGKQAYEIFEGWLGDPAMILRKSSSVVREAFEQVTGTSTGGWELPFKDEGWSGTLAADGSVWKGRLGYTVQKFLPISLTSLAQGKPTAFIAPTSKGVSEGGVVYSMRKVLDAYVDNNLLPKELQPVDLSVIVPELIEAARRNGIDPELAFRRAKGSITSKYYKKFFEAMNNGDEAAMERAAVDVLKLGKGLDSFHKSMEGRLDAVSREYGPEMQEQVAAAFNRAKDR